MPRKNRPYCPGVAFHVMTRFIDRAHHFNAEMKPVIVRVISDACRFTDAQVLAMAVMDSHLHLVVRQGDDPLFRLVQPALRRIALMVQKRFRVEGHVFGREFLSFPCLTASYLREAIIYTHLNPVRAGLVSDPSDGDSTSHAAYIEMPATEDLAFITPALELFAESWSGTVLDWRRSYLDYMEFRMACDRCDAAALPRPAHNVHHSHGDAFFAANFSLSSMRTVNTSRVRRDLRDLVTDILAIRAPGTPVSSVRGAFLTSRHLQQIRHEIIGIAAGEGHSGRNIARFFLMSPTRVSQVTRAFINTKRHPA